MTKEELKNKIEKIINPIAKSKVFKVVNFLFWVVYFVSVIFLFDNIIIPVITETIGMKKYEGLYYILLDIFTNYNPNRVVLISFFVSYFTFIGTTGILIIKVIINKVILKRKCYFINKIAYGCGIIIHVFYLLDFFIKR